MKRPDWLKLSPPVVFSLLAVGVVGLGSLVVFLPRLQTASLQQGVDDYRATTAKPDPEKLATLEKGRLDSENAIRAALIQGLGGTAILVSIYFTYQNLKATQRHVLLAEEKQITERKTAEANLKLAEAKQVTERFSKAVEMLSNSNLHTRLGGIYALERIARDSDNDYWQVMEVLTAFVREESPWPPKDIGATAHSGQVERLPATPLALAAESEPKQTSGLLMGLIEVEIRDHVQDLLAKIPPLRTDIQAVMTVIGRRKYRYGESEWETQPLDLTYTDLRRLVASKANLTGMKLYETHMEGADLEGADLEGAELRQVYLAGASLQRANLKGARLIELDLTKVIGLTPEQIKLVADSRLTKLPFYLASNQ